MTVKSASYKLNLPTIIEIAPNEPNCTELCKQKLINPHLAAGENS